MFTSNGIYRDRMVLPILEVPCVVPRGGDARFMEETDVRQIK